VAGNGGGEDCWKPRWSACAGEVDWKARGRGVLAGGLRTVRGFLCGRGRRCELKPQGWSRGAGGRMCWCWQDVLWGSSAVGWWRGCASRRREQEARAGVQRGKVPQRSQGLYCMLAVWGLL
jgi:hypothetical protein